MARAGGMTTGSKDGGCLDDRYSLSLSLPPSLPPSLLSFSLPSVMHLPDPQLRSSATTWTLSSRRASKLLCPRPRS